MIMSSGTGRSDYFTFSLPEIIYFHSIASLFVIPLLMWLHIDFFVSTSKTVIVLPLKFGIQRHRGHQCHFVQGLYDFIS